MGLVKLDEVHEDGDPAKNVMELRKVSMGVDDFLSNKSYLAVEDMDEDEVSQPWLMHKAHKIALEELGELGLVPTVDHDEMSLDGHRMNLICQYRREFDGGVLAECLGEADDSTLAALETKLDYPEGGEGEVHREVLRELVDRYPNNETWKNMLEYADLFRASKEFAEHTTGVINAISDKDHHSVINAVRMGDVSGYLESVSRRRHNYHTAISCFVRNSKDVDKLRLMDSARSHDLDLANTDAVSVVGSKFDDVDEALVSDSEFVRQHRMNKKHHPEYYAVQQITPDRTQIAMMLAELYDPYMGRDKYFETVKKEMERFGVPTVAIAEQLAEDVEFRERPTSVTITTS